MCRAAGVGDDDRMRRRWPVVLALAVYAAGAVLHAMLATDPVGVFAPLLALLAVPVAVGCLLAWRVPASPVGAALAWVGAAPSAVFALEWWGGSARGDDPWPAAAVLYHVQLGAWVWNVAGFAALCLVFPDGLLPGPRWRRVVGGAVAAGLYVNAVQASVGLPADDQPVRLPLAGVVAVNALGYALCLGALGATVASLVVRYRRGDSPVRQQLRWLLAGAGTVPLLLALGWVLQAFGATPGLAYVGLFVAMLVAVPAAVAIAVLRYDLFDVDRLLGSSLAWLLTTVGAAAVFALLVTAGGEVGADSRLGTTGAAFVTALALLPMHRGLHRLVGRVVDRDRHVVAARVAAFVQAVRDGAREPEETEDVFRAVLGDPGLRLLLRLPGADDSYVDPAGQTRPRPPSSGGVVPLRSGDTEVGLLVLGTPSARRLRRAREVAVAARLPIEVSRLRLSLRAALDDVRSSRERLVAAADAERRRLEHDLHDGAQQQIVSVGMRLRSTQRALPPDSPARAEIDAAVEALEATIAELRRLAHGIRPARLDDGLPAALRSLVADGPVPVHLAVADLDLADVVATTAFFVVAEAYANALKHARATAIEIGAALDGAALRVRVADDGVGGAGSGLTSVRDRVASVGGTLSVTSPPGGGTRVEVEIPDAHRRRG